MKNPPRDNLAPDSQGWRRWVNDGILDLNTRLSVLSNNVTNLGKALGGNLRVMGDQLRQVQERTQLVTLTVIDGIVQETPVLVQGPDWASLAVVTASVGSETVSVTESERGIVITAGMSELIGDNPPVLDLITFSYQTLTWKEFYPSTVMGREVWIGQGGEADPPAGYDATFYILIQWF